MRNLSTVWKKAHLHVGSFQVRHTNNMQFFILYLLYHTVILPPVQRVTPENNRESQSNHGLLDDGALANWDGWGEFFLVGKFSEYQGPTLTKLFRDGVKLTSYEFAKCAMSGKHGEASKWGKWTPTAMRCRSKPRAEADLPPRVLPLRLTRVVCSVPSVSKTIRSHKSLP